MSRFTNPVPQYLDGAGNPLVNAKLTFFAAGTSTEIITYADDLETIPNTNPVLLGADARVPNIWYSGSARVVLTADNVTTGQIGEQIWDRDPVGGENEAGDFAPWVTTVDYDLNDIVEGSDNKFYKSLANGNQGNDPTLSPANWEQINFLGVYNAAKTYSAGDVAQTANGNLWASQINSNIGNDPAIDSGANWLPAISSSNVLAPTNTVIPQTGGGELTALRVNELRDAGAYTLPLANTVEANQFIVVELPDEFKAFEPTVTTSGSDTITYSGGTDTSITFDSGSSISLRLTSNGSTEWGL